MKKLTFFKSFILNNKGETLVESIISILIFVIFVSGITTVINTSIKVTDDSRRAAEATQFAANQVFSGTATIGTSTFTLTGDSINVSMDVIILRDEENTFTAFLPD